MHYIPMYCPEAQLLVCLSSSLKQDEQYGLFLWVFVYILTLQIGKITETSENPSQLYLLELS